jgi:predicted transcriptional regulator
MSTIRPPAETDEERRARLIDEARASAAAGETVPWEEVEAWMESWFTDHELPMPTPKPKR